MELEDMNKAELIKEAKKRKVELPLRAKKKEILKLLKKPVIAPAEEVVPVEEAEISETPIIEGEQATAPIEPEIIPPLQPDEKIVTEVTVNEPNPGRMPASMDEFPTIPRPAVAKEPEPAELSHPITCSGCKATVDSSTVQLCLICPKSLVFCPACAKAGTCHKCGMKLDPDED